MKIKDNKLELTRLDVLKMHYQLVKRYRFYKNKTKAKLRLQLFFEKNKLYFLILSKKIFLFWRKIVKK